MLKNTPANAGHIRHVGREDPLEQGMATHSTILAWRIPWTEEPGGPESHRVRHNKQLRTPSQQFFFLMHFGYNFFIRIWLINTFS